MSELYSIQKGKKYIIDTQSRENLLEEIAVGRYRVIHYTQMNPDMFAFYKRELEDYEKAEEQWMIVEMEKHSDPAYQEWLLEQDRLRWEDERKVNDIENKKVNKELSEYYIKRKLINVIKKHFGNEFSEEEVKTIADETFPILKKYDSETVEKEMEKELIEYIHNFRDEKQNKNIISEQDLNEIQEMFDSDMPGWMESTGEISVLDTKKEEKNSDENEVQLPHYMQYFDVTENGMKFKSVYYVKDVLENHMNMFNDGNFLWRYLNGVYKPDGQEIFGRFTAKILDEKYKPNYYNVSLDYLKKITYVAKEEKEQLVNPNDGYINLKNGLLNYESGEIVKHSPDRYSTVQFPIEYKPDANDPKVMKFIKSIVPEDCVDTIFEMIGYCLIPTTRYQKAFMLTGSGSNGKSVLINIIEKLLGRDNFSGVTLQDLDKNRFKVAQLYGKMANICADLSDNALQETGTFKKVVAGDTISGEFKGVDSFDFKPFAKLIFSANEVPNSRDNTEGFFRRWIIIPFPNKFEGKNANPYLEDELSTPEALSTFLNLALDGLRRIIKNDGITNPESSRKLIHQYKIDSDSVASFFDEQCELGDNYSINTTEFYNEYKAYCVESGLNPEGKKKFHARIESKFNLERKRLKRGQREEWIGVTMIKCVEEKKNGLRIAQ